MWNSTAKELDRAEEGFSLLVFAPANLQIFSIMNNIISNSWKEEEGEVDQMI